MKNTKSTDGKEATKPVVGASAEPSPKKALASGEEMFSTVEACAITGASYRSVDYWARNKVLAPAIQATGIGTERQYTFRDVLALAAIMQLHKHASLELRQQVVEMIRKNPSARQLHVEVGKFCYLTIYLGPLRVYVRAAALAKARGESSPSDTPGFPFPNKSKPHL